MFRSAPASVSCLLFAFASGQIFGASPERKHLALPPLFLSSAEPATLIRHEVEWSSQLDKPRQESMLTGPTLFATQAASNARDSASFHFSWYKLPPTSPGSQKRVRKVELSWEEGRSSRSLELDEPRYLLSQSQVLGAGKPAPVPDGLSQYVAYAIVGNPDLLKSAKLPVKEVEMEYKLKSAAFLCLPAEQWHHHEHIPVKDSLSCWIAYEITAVGDVTPISTLDQFGLNELTIDSPRWLCLPVTLKAK